MYNFQMLTSFVTINKTKIVFWSKLKKKIISLTELKVIFIKQVKNITFNRHLWKKS